MPIVPRSLLTLMDWTRAHVELALAESARLKKRQKEGRLAPVLAGRTLALIFEKASMRTRVSFEVAMTQLGGQTIYLTRDDVRLGEREPVRDGARVLSRNVDVIAARTFHHSTVEELARYATVPVINALTDLSHPCQALADALTIRERFGEAQGLKVAFIGDCNNVAHSLAVACAHLGMAFVAAAPEGYRFEQAFLESLKGMKEPGTPDARIVGDPREAAAGADVLYTDVWVSMGQEQETAERRRAFAGYCIDRRLTALAKPGAIVLHCLPAHRGEEITDEVIEGPQSAVFDQAENRLHTQRALLRLMVTQEATG